MKFNDLTVFGGAIHSRREHYTQRLDQHAVLLARQLYRQARAALEREIVFRGIPGQPFRVRIGLPPQYGHLAEAPGNGLVFCVSPPDGEYFQYNCVLPASETRDECLWALHTVLGISYAGVGAPENSEAMEGIAESYLTERPLLATALMPTEILPTAEGQALIRLCADFSTCFGAAMLQELS